MSGFVPEIRYFLNPAMKTGHIFIHFYVWCRQTTYNLRKGLKILKVANA